MTEFWLIRHGETDWNTVRRCQGHTDIPLNATGLQQAAALAKKIAGISFAAIYSSDLQRAYRTAQILAAPINLPIQTDIRLREIHQGAWEGRLVSEIRAEIASNFPGSDVDLVDVEQPRAPGGESVRSVLTRMTTIADEISARHPSQRVT